MIERTTWKTSLGMVAMALAATGCPDPQSECERMAAHVYDECGFQSFPPPETQAPDDDPPQTREEFLAECSADANNGEVPGFLVGFLYGQLADCLVGVSCEELQTSGDPFANGTCDLSDGEGDGDGDGDDDVDGELCAPREGSTTSVPETQRTDTYPTPAGGTPLDGTWDLATFEVYAPATADENVRQDRIVIEGNTIVNIRSESGTTALIGATWVVDGTDLVMSVECPEATEIRVPFTATETELRLFDPSEPNLKVYVRQ
jgi:hypothetical protein